MSTRGLWSITRNAFVEVVRQPIYAILLGAGLALIALSPVVTAFTMMDDIKLTVDMGLATIFMFGIVLSVLGASQVISDEVESKTAGAVISKPVNRIVFVAGKFLGVAFALALASYLLALMLLMTVRMGVPTTVAFEVDVPVLLAQTLPLLLAVVFGMHCNFFYRSSFTAAAIRAGFVLYTLAFVLLLFIGRDWGFEWITPAFTETDAWPIALAAVTVFFGVLVISSVALAASTRVNIVANVMICLGVFFVGMISSYLFGWTVDMGGVRWEPDGTAETVTISGTITDRAGQPVEGVRLIGAPRPPVVTDESGRYEVRVRRGGSGELSPRKHRYGFRPESRPYAELGARRREQDFEAVRHPFSVSVYAGYAWTALARAAYHLTPSLQLFWVGDQLMRPNPYISAGYVLRASLYGLIWTMAMVAFAAFLFEGRELA